jgi:hypothetical protein
MGHQVGNQVERAYRRTDVLEKRRELMVAWASYCFERHTSVGIAVRAQHIAMGEKTDPTKNAPADRIEAQGLHAVERRLPQSKLIEMGWRRSAIDLVHVLRVIQSVAEARMRFQSCAVGQIDRVGAKIIDRGKVIVVSRWTGCVASYARQKLASGTFVRQDGPGNRGWRRGRRRKIDRPNRGQRRPLAKADERLNCHRLGVFLL